jgi:hypothetical protein
MMVRLKLRWQEDDSLLMQRCCHQKNDGGHIENFALPENRDAIANG